MDSEKPKEIRLKRCESNSTDIIQTLGLNAVTIFENSPFFFLFSDIDSKNLEELLTVLKLYQHRHLSCYYYETTKGYHVISPVLLPIRKWVSLVEQLKKQLPDYRFDTIRHTPRPTDGKVLFWCKWNTIRLESWTLHELLRTKFNKEPLEKLSYHVLTKLDYSIYDQLHLLKYRHFGF